jgi:hypothetical protein
MATELIMPTLPDPQQQGAYYHHGRPHHQRSHSYQTPSNNISSTAMSNTSYSAQVSPLSTSNNTSPTSPKSYHARQVRPLYMPAVLRPTEFPSKLPNLSSSKSSTFMDDEDDMDARTLSRSNGSFMSLTGLSVLSQRLSRRSTGVCSKSTSEDCWDLDLFPKVTGFPTRKHWKVS